MMASVPLRRIPGWPVSAGGPVLTHSACTTDRVRPPCRTHGLLNTGCAAGAILLHRAPAGFRFVK